MPTTSKGTPYVVSTDLVANYPTVSSDLADHIDDNLTYNAQTINAQTGTTYTFALADATLNKLVTATNAAASTYTVPPQSSVTWVAGSVLRILNEGAGAVTLTPGSGVTLNGSSLVLSQYQYAELQRTASNTWTVTGLGAAGGLTKVTDQTFTTAATVSVNNCFSSTYQNYRVIFYAAASGGTPDVQIRLRVSGSDNTTSAYEKQTLEGGGTTPSASRSTGQTSWNIGALTTTDYGAFALDIYRPFEATATAASNWELRRNGPVVRFDALYFTSGTSFDGFTIYPSTNSITGVVRVYGYRN